MGYTLGFATHFCLCFAVEPMDCPTDIVFVVDESGSIGSTLFDLMTVFLSQLVSRLDIDSGKTRVGLITYSSNVGSGFNMSDYRTVNAVQSAISALTHTGVLTRTARALKYVRTTMLTTAAGDRGNVPNVVVVLTDGQSTNRRATRVSITDLQCLHVYFYHARLC